MKASARAFSIGMFCNLLTGMKILVIVMSKTRIL